MNEQLVNRTADERAIRRPKVFTERQFVSVWIRGDIPEVGNANLMVTSHNTEALLWRSQGYVVTETFKIIDRIAAV